MTIRSPPDSGNQSISVAALITEIQPELELEVVAGKEGLQRVINHRRIQKSGLALVGHMHGIVPTRVQVLGATELSYFDSLKDAAQRRAAVDLCSIHLSALLISRGAVPPPHLIAACNDTSTPLLVSVERSSAVIAALHSLLDDRLAPRTRIHGVLIDVFEVGVLLLGKSGIGKSECALELVMRGHRLVADDVVDCDYRPPGMVFGEPADLLRHHIEVRGLGILDIMDLYGVTSIRDRKRVDLVVQLEEQLDDRHIDRTGLEERKHEILGVPIREVLIPVKPGRNTSAIIEIAARHELLRQSGHDSSKSFIERIDAELSSGAGESSSHMPSVSVAVPPSKPWGQESSVPPPVKKREPVK